MRVEENLGTNMIDPQSIIGLTPNIETYERIIKLNGIETIVPKFKIKTTKNLVLYCAA